MFKRLFTAAMILGPAALAPPVFAQGMPTCADREGLTTALANRYNERLTGSGLQSPVQILELWTSPETGTFSILLTRPDGKSCLVASGDHWYLVPPERAEQAADAEPAAG